MLKKYSRKFSIKGSLKKKKEDEEGFPMDRKNPKAYTPLGWKTRDNAATLNKREQHVDLTEAIRRLSIYA